jgi:putative ABC transport system permease protein
MIKNWAVITFRNLLKNKVFTLINIIGLGISLAICIVAYFNTMFNYEFDRTHENFDKIYRVTSFRDMEGREQEYGIVPATLGLEIGRDIPGIETSARLIRSNSPVKLGDNIFPSSIAWVDPAFTKIFTLHTKVGGTKSIDDQATVMISHTMAERLFGTEHPVGKAISIVNDNNQEFTYMVGAVFEDLPENSSFRIDILSHIDNFLLMWNLKDSDWKIWANALFITVPDKSMLPAITTSLKDYLPVQNRAREDFRINRFNVIPLKDVGASSRVIFSSSLFPSLHPAALISPPFMALFILLIACFNFANTSIATFSKRLKEIGLRKTFGGQRKELAAQFMFETLIICLLALLVGIGIAEFLVPAYSSLWAYMSIELTFTGHPVFWGFLILLLFATGFFAGVYPAIFVSSFSPVSVLRGSTPFRSTTKLSVVLLTLQFTISVMALVLGIVFAKNAEYQQTLDRGYEQDKLIVVPVNPSLYSSLRNETLSNPKVIAAEGTQSHIGYGYYRRPVKDSAKQLEVDVLDIGAEYATTMGLRLVAGRHFNELRSAADISNNSILVNEKLVSDFGWKNPVGKTLTLYDTTTLTVIGVTEDFYTNGLWEAIEPTMLRLATPDRYGLLVVRANTEDLPEVLDFISLKWKELSTNMIFGGRFQEDIMQEEKDINGSIMKVNMFLAIVAALLSLIGMYNMVSLDIIRRTKEVGIRKIQGAPVPVLMFLISRKFLYVLAIASIIGCAAGYYLSLMLLDSIWDYFTKIGVGILITSAGIMIVTTVAVIIFKIGRAALRNPVEALRYE